MTADASIVGILLAAGLGRRFDPDGRHNKLMQLLRDGDPVVVRAAKNLRAVLPNVLAVIRPGGEAISEVLSAVGCAVTVCPHADQGMGASIAHAVRQTANARGWLIALGDMPAVRPATIEALSGAISKGADIAAPVFNGQRGNPVAFSRVHVSRLLMLGGDQGARALLQSLPVTMVPVQDPGVVTDVDTTGDLAALR